MGIGALVVIFLLVLLFQLVQRGLNTGEAFAGHLMAHLDGERIIADTYGIGKLPLIQAKSFDLFTDVLISFFHVLPPKFI